MSSLVRLRRHDTSTPWGFRMNGGAEMGQPLYIQKVQKGSIAFKSGLRPGDAILQIGQAPTNGMQHVTAKMEILRAGNEVDFIVQRSVIEAQVPQQPNLVHNHATAEVVEEQTVWRSSPMDPAVQSRSFKLLQAQMGSQ